MSHAHRVTEFGRTPGFNRLLSHLFSLSSLYRGNAFVAMDVTASKSANSLGPLSTDKDPPPPEAQVGFCSVNPASANAPNEAAATVGHTSRE